MYAKVCELKTGLCYLDNFSANLGLAVTEPVIKLFELFDQVILIKAISI